MPDDTAEREEQSAPRGARGAEGKSGVSGFISKKIGGVPLWGWALGGGALLIIVAKMRKGSSSSSGASQGATAGGLSSFGSGAGSGGGGFGDYSGGQSVPGTPVAQTPSGPTISSQVGPQIGSGFSSLTPGQVIQTAGGAFEWVTNPSTAAALQANGQQLFFQSAPGVFAPAAPNQQFSPGTPLYQQVDPTASGVSVAASSGTRGLIRSAQPFMSGAAGATSQPTTGAATVISPAQPQAPVNGTSPFQSQILSRLGS